MRLWQHVLDPVQGYLTLIERMAGDPDFAGTWKFRAGPANEVPVRADRLSVLGGDGTRWAGDPRPHEAARLRLDCDKGRTRLVWTAAPQSGPRASPDHRLALGENRDLRQLSLGQIDAAMQTGAAAAGVVGA